MATTECEIWLAVNAKGEYQAHDGKDDAEDGMEGAYRLIKLVLTIPVPGPLVLTAVIPDTAGEVKLTVQQ